MRDVGRALCLLALGGCVRFSFPFAASPAPAPVKVPLPSGSSRPALTVVLAKAVPRQTETRAAIERALGSSFALSFAEPPSASPPPDRTAVVEQELAAARKSYVNAEFGACLERTGEIQRVGDLLADGERLLGGRLLFWRIACTVGAGRMSDARRDATAFATYGLAIPADVEAAAPDVEALIADTIRLVSDAPRHSLRITASAAGRLAPHAVVSVDGRADAGVAPCTVDLPAGDHAVRIDADGHAPEMRIVRVEEPGSAISFSLSAADPELAARQWNARHAGSPAIDSAASVGLLATALRARSLAVVAVEAAPKGVRLAGALALDGGISARGERLSAGDAEVPDAATALLRDLLLRGQLLEAAPPIHKRPIFWVGVGLAAVAAATVTTLLLYEPERQIEVTF